MRSSRKILQQNYDKILRRHSNNTHTSSARGYMRECRSFRVNISCKKCAVLDSHAKTENFENSPSACRRCTTEIDLRASAAEAQKLILSISFGSSRFILVVALYNIIKGHGSRKSQHPHSANTTVYDVKDTAHHRPPPTSAFPIVYCCD